MLAMSEVSGSVFASHRTCGLGFRLVSTHGTPKTSLRESEVPVMETVGHTFELKDGVEMISDKCVLLN